MLCHYLSLVSHYFSASAKLCFVTSAFPEYLYLNVFIPSMPMPDGCYNCLIETCYLHKDAHMSSVHMNSGFDISRPQGERESSTHRGGSNEYSLCF